MFGLLGLSNRLIHLPLFSLIPTLSKLVISNYENKVETQKKQRPEMLTEFSHLNRLK